MFEMTVESHLKAKGKPSASLAGLFGLAFFRGARIVEKSVELSGYYRVFQMKIPCRDFHHTIKRR